MKALRGTTRCPPMTSAQRRHGGSLGFWRLLLHLIAEVRNFVSIRFRRFARRRLSLSGLVIRVSPVSAQCLCGRTNLDFQELEEANARRFMRFLAWGPPFTPCQNLFDFAGLAMKARCGQCNTSKISRSTKLRGCFDLVRSVLGFPSTPDGASPKSASTKSSASNSRRSRLARPRDVANRNAKLSAIPRITPLWQCRRVL